MSNENILNFLTLAALIIFLTGVIVCILSIRETKMQREKNLRFTKVSTHLIENIRNSSVILKMIGDSDFFSWQLYTGSDFCMFGTGSLTGRIWIKVISNGVSELGFKSSSGLSLESKNDRQRRVDCLFRQFVEVGAWEEYTVVLPSDEILLAEIQRIMKSAITRVRTNQ